jgi:N-acetyl-gamma-glutamyl-phosphate reductase
MHMTISVAIAGGSGYAGGELLRLLSFHPEFQVSTVAAGEKAGDFVRSVHPHLTQWRDLVFSETDPELLAEHDLVFLAMPHGKSAEIANQLPTATRVVDLGADFRLESPLDWQKYYGAETPHAGSWLYGLPELVDHGLIADAMRVANPGCYATAIALAAAPAVSLGLVDPLDLVVVAASGTSGAGRTNSQALLGAEVMGSISSYKTGGVHQHIPEIEQMLQQLSGVENRLSFTPLLAPMSRGIHVTFTAKLTQDFDANLTYKEFYARKPFITVLEAGEQPKTASVLGVNHVQVQAMIDEHTNRLVVTCVIDNLVKGAAGQAIQNANLMYKFPETLGLDQMGVAP